MANAFFLKLILGMGLAKKTLQFGNLGLVLAQVTIAAERSFRILGQFISPPTWEIGIDAIFAGDMS